MCRYPYVASRSIFNVALSVVVVVAGAAIGHAQCAIGKACPDLKGIAGKWTGTGHLLRPRALEIGMSDRPTPGFAAFGATQSPAARGATPAAESIEGGVIRCDAQRDEGSAKEPSVFVEHAPTLRFSWEPL